MLTDEQLRFEVKALKAFHNVSFKAISEQLGIKTKSLYQWKQGQFNLSDSRKLKLEKIIEQYKGR